MTCVTRSRIELRRRQNRFLESIVGRLPPPPKPLKPYHTFSIPAEVNEDLDCYLNNIADRKRLKRFSAASVRAWFLTRGYEKQ